jgi:hypothetical protein
LVHRGYLDSVSHGIQPIQYQQVVSQPADIPRVGLEVSNIFGIQPIQSQQALDITRPPVSDYLDIRATVPGCVSYRDDDTGKYLKIKNLPLLKLFL